MRKILLALCLTANLTTGVNATASEASLQWSSGVDFTSGDYSDNQTTDILYVPATVKALFGDFEAKVTVPYIRITGPGTVVGGGDVGPIRRDRTPNTITTQDGLGDITAALTYTTYHQDDTLFVDFTGKAKLPTASRAKNLGTGKADFTGQVDLTKVLGDVSLFGTAGYRVMGSSDLLPLENGFIGSTGFSLALSSKTSVGAIYDYRQSASIAASASDPSELTGFLTWKASDQVRLQTYGVIGFSNGSPDHGVGFQISFRP